MRCLVVLACVCAVAYARAQSSVDSSALKTNAEITQEEPVEELNTSDLKINSISNQGSEADDANNNENETNVSNNGEVLDVAPTILAPSVPIPKPDETNYSAKNEDLDVAPTNLAPSVPISKPDETNYSANNEDLDVAPTNLAPSVPISKPDETNYSANNEVLDVAPTNLAPSVPISKSDETNYSAKDEDLDVAPTNLAPSVIISKPDETNYSANNEDLDVAPTNLAPSVPISKPDETNYSVKDEDLDVAPTNLAPSVIISKPDETNYSPKDEDLDVAPTNLAPSVIISKPDETNYSTKDKDLDVAPTNLAPIIVADIDESDNSVNDEDLEVAPTNLAPSISSERQGRYKALPNQESAPRSGGKFICKEKNERYSVPGSCDSYIECLNGTAEEKQCPDGLRYNPNVLFNVYPCQYPIDVPCLGRSALQPAQPTADCPHQFGYFKTGDSRNCSGFRNCVNGVGYEFTCPDGLAFSSDTYRCEWPDQVSDCDAEAFLGFRCPEVPATKELGPPAGFRFYRSPSDCQVYFLCIDGKPRRLGCGGYSAFDELTETCVNAEEVSVCPQELKTRAAQAKEKEERRRRLLEENPLKQSRYISRELPTNVPTYSEPEPEQNLDEENGVESVTPTQLGPELEE